MSSSCFKIWEVSRSFQEFFLSCKRIEENLKDIETCYEDMDTVSWKYWCDRLNSLRDLSSALKRSLNFKLAHRIRLKYQINKRRRKRRKKWCNPNLCTSKHEISSLHRLYLQQNADEEKQRGKLKSEADSVLFSVRQKKIEAKHHIRLLAALQKLHTSRTRNLSSGNKLSASSGFVQITGKLMILWNNHLKEYVLEENGLNIMLKHSTLREESECSRSAFYGHNEKYYAHLKRDYKKWLTLIYGSNDLQNSLYYTTVQEFVCIRQKWDQFVCDKRHEKASKIPVGWIIPKYHCEDSWSDFIQN